MSRMERRGCGCGLAVSLDGQALPGAGMAGSGVRVGELEAQYPLYCKAMRILVRDGVSLAKARRTVCWQKLEHLHRSLPRHYREPEQLYLHLLRDQRDCLPMA
jgi:hypothetical protein